MRRPLPPLKTLEGFEAAARLGSFSAAAEALGLTQSAISHQIQLLESALGQPLFRRLHRCVLLTDAGRDFQRSVQETLRGLREGVGRLEPYRKPGSVVVYCDAALAASWLAPRLQLLRQAHGGLDIWLDSSNRAVDFARDEVDLLLRRQGDEARLQAGTALRSMPLFEEWLQPLAAPALAHALRRGALLENLRAATLLHEEGFDGWPAWFEAAGAADRKAPPAWLSRGPNFSDAQIMLLAAAQGLGVALGSSVIAAPFLARGDLAWVSPRRLAVPAGYAITATEEGLADPEIRQVFDWIVAEAAAACPPDSGAKCEVACPPDF